MFSSITLKPSCYDISELRSVSESFECTAEGHELGRVGASLASLGDELMSLSAVSTGVHPAEFGDATEVVEAVAGLTAMHAAHPQRAEAYRAKVKAAQAHSLASPVVNVQSWWDVEHIKHQFSSFEMDVQWIVSPAGLCHHSSSSCGMHMLRSLLFKRFVHGVSCSAKSNRA